MRMNARTKREMAVSAAILDMLAAQVASEADHACMEPLDIGRLRHAEDLLRKVARDLFDRAMPKARP